MQLSDKDETHQLVDTSTRSKDDLSRIVSTIFFCIHIEICQITRNTIASLGEYFFMDMSPIVDCSQLLLFV